MPELKRCSKCEEEKSLSEFYKDKNTKDGLCYRCKKCQLFYRQEYYQENREQIRIQAHKYYETHKEDKHQYNLKYRERMRRRDCKRAGLGYNPLNKWFEGSVMHHIDNINIVFILKEIHQKFPAGNGHSLKQHRDGILRYYGSVERMIENNPIGGMK